MIAESVRHALSDPGHSHLPLCPDYEGDSPKGEPLELRFPVKTGIVMDKPPALAVGCMTEHISLFCSRVDAKFDSFGEHDVSHPSNRNIISYILLEVYIFRLEGGGAPPPWLKPGVPAPPEIDGDQILYHR